MRLGNTSGSPGAQSADLGIFCGKSYSPENMVPTQKEM